MSEASQNFFWSPGGPGGHVKGGSRGDSFLKICILGIFGDFSSNLSWDRCQKPPKKIFDLQGGQGGEYTGAAGGASFLKICILGIFGYISSNLSWDRCQKPPTSFLSPRGDSKRGTSRGASFLKICILGNLPKIFLTPRGASTLCTGMEILTWFLVGGKYYSHTWFLYATGLLRYQGPPEKLKKAKIFLAFFIFLWSLIPKNSSGIQKSCVWVVFQDVFHPPTKNQHKNSILVYLPSQKLSENTGKSWRTMIQDLKESSQRPR